MWTIPKKLNLKLVDFDCIQPTPKLRTILILYFLKFHVVVSDGFDFHGIVQVKVDKITLPKMCDLPRVGKLV